MTGFVSSCSNLVDAIQEFGNKIETLVITGIEKLESAKLTQIKCEYEVKAVFENFHLMIAHAFTFVDKVYYIFDYGKETKNAKESLQSGEIQPLMELLDTLMMYLAEVEEAYRIFEEHYKIVSQSCLEAAKMCKCKSEEVKKNKWICRVKGGVKAGASFAGAAVLGVAAVGVGIATLGVGAPLSAPLGVAAASLGGVGTGQAAVTAVTSSKLNDEQKGLSEFGMFFDDMWLASLNLKDKIDISHIVKTIKDRVNDVEFHRANNHRIETICKALDRQQKVFKTYHGAILSCQEKLRTKKQEFHDTFFD